MEQKQIFLFIISFLTMTSCIKLEDEYSSSKIDDAFLFQEDRYIHSIKFVGPQSIIYSTNDRITLVNTETMEKQVIFDPSDDIFYVIFSEDPNVLIAMVLEFNPNNPIRTSETFYKIEPGNDPEFLDIQLWYDEYRKNAVIWDDNIAYNFGNGYDIYTNDLYVKMDENDPIFIDQGSPITVSPTLDRLLYSKLDTADYTEELAWVNLSDNSIFIIPDTKKEGYGYYVSENFAWTERGIIEMYRTSSNVTITDHDKGEQIFSTNVRSEPYWPFTSPECGWIAYQIRVADNYFQNQNTLRLMNPFMDIPEYDAITTNNNIERMIFSPNCDQMAYLIVNKVYLLDLK